MTTKRATSQGTDADEVLDALAENLTAPTITDADAMVAYGLYAIGVALGEIRDTLNFIAETLADTITEEPTQ